MGAIQDCSVLLLVVPAQTMRSNLRHIRDRIQQGTAILSCTKGVEVATGKRMSEIIVDEIPSAAARLAVLSGPNLALEVAAGLPAATVVASHNKELAVRLQSLLITPSLRVYTNADVVGVELGGALKNIIAIGAGFCDGLGLGDNAKASFMGRGLLEIARLGVAAGAEPMTFAGLAGLGDMIATCGSAQSRNRFMGEQLARGRSLFDVEGGLHMVAEGVATTRAARSLAQRYGVEMPIAEMTYAVLFDGKDVREALSALMTRDPKDEFAGIVVES
jgi:glycerol-3-phosphate dehydrogenase (NAD(P)+)